ncbi:conserved hypothetical protein [uncultured Eubacteriales bacterium]|uniref:Peptidase M20 dimerisation domain-containing protein n=1 Tax=uncultured Eubacteriales bacterium TaxID=172733 RepID=A0A212J0Z4_9FIRM|nr:conserved hypothetical protein [uncultured Eubacteriales bacterium]
MDKTEERILQIIDSRRDDIIAFARDIYTHAELGYKETRTARRFEEQLRALGLPEIQTGLAVTGVKGYLKEPARAEGPALALIGELDALRIPNHKCANPDTQSAHCCGHHAQLAGVVGAAYALTDSGVSETLTGNVVFFAVPAEEYGEIEFKNSLREQGVIRYGGGKCELIRIGAFDDVDLSVVHHSSNAGISVGTGSSNGFVSKTIHIKGRAAHAAGAPHLGINALNAAALGHTALQYQRETFQDKDSVRVHPIITKGGDLVNVVPDTVTLETLVRASNTQAILDASRKTDRAYKAGADALGAGYEIETMPGYLPKLPAPAHPALVEAARLAAPGVEVELVDPATHTTGSTDVGDLQHIQPVLSFSTGGVAGAFHSPSFDVVDEEEAYIVTAKIFALSAYRLLKDNAREARDVVAGYSAPLSKSGYIDFMEALIKQEKKEVAVDE